MCPSCNCKVPFLCSSPKPISQLIGAPSHDCVSSHRLQNPKPIARRQEIQTLHKTFASQQAVYAKVVTLVNTNKQTNKTIFLLLLSAQKYSSERIYALSLRNLHWTKKEKPSFTPAWQHALCVGNSVLLPLSPLSRALVCCCCMCSNQEELHSRRRPGKKWESSGGSYNVGKKSPLQGGGETKKEMVSKVFSMRRRRMFFKW